MTKITKSIKIQMILKSMGKKVEQKVKSYFSTFKSKIYKKGEKILTPDTPLLNAFYISSGVVRMFDYTKSGTEITLNMFKAGSFFPVGQIINNSSNHYYYDAVSTTTLFIAPKKMFYKFLKENPEVTLDLMKRIYKGLEGYYKRMESHSFGAASEKTITELLILVSRFDKKLKLSHYQIASLAGLSRETVTREISKLKKQGIISTKGSSLQVINKEKLEQKLSS